MSLIPPLLILGLGLMLLVVLLMVVALRVGTNLPRVASFVSRATIVVSVLWVLVLGITLFAGGPIQVTAPIALLPFHLPEGIELDGLRATILSGGFDQVTVQASGLGLPTLLVVLAAAVLASGTLIGVCLVVDRLARSLGEGDPFALSGEALQRAAWIVLVGGTLVSMLDDVSNWLASTDLFWVTGASWSSDVTDASSLTELGWPEPAAFSLTIPFWPLGAGMVLALLAGVFRYGRQLRRDAAGLV